MATIPPAPARRGPPAVAWILLIAVLIGAAAALLARPFGTPGPGTPFLPNVTVQQFAEICAVLLLLGLGIWLFLALRTAGTRGAFSERLVGTMLVTIILGVVVVEILDLVHAAPITGKSNSTSPSPSPGTPTNGTGGPLPPILHASGVTIPGWAGFAVLIAIAFLAVVAVTPVLRARAARRREQAERDAAGQEAHAALQEALHRLSEANPEDARAAILALYSRLLLLVGPRLGRLESRTPREIERDSIVVLGLRPVVAEGLRETFEEARYSTHPMTADSVARARAALAEAAADLARPRGDRP